MAWGDTLAGMISGQFKIRNRSLLGEVATAALLHSLIADELSPGKLMSSLPAA